MTTTFRTTAGAATADPAGTADTVDTVGTDRPAKLARLAALLDARGADRLQLTTAENLAWFFDGARVAVPLSGPPVFTATVHRSGRVQVAAFANELDRLAEEELGDDVELTAVPWHSPLPIAGGPGECLSDVELAGELRAARAELLPLERLRFSGLGADLARAATRILSTADPAESERELAARAAGEVVALGADPVVLLVAGEGRVHHRHPLPSDAPLGGRAMLALGARRHGLVASLTRWVGFATPGAPSAEGLEPRERALLEVEADALAATRPGRRLGEVLSDIAVSYERHGLGSDAWLGHHQGGPTGYLGRDPRATPGARDLVVSGQAFAWNPSVRGHKVEDTVIVDDDGCGDRTVTVLTVDPEWPTVAVNGLRRPAALRPASVTHAP
ncbi:M24 family metallopeptidase [Herbiconiux sp. A18JL235]|uniref:M24 family metallopeptidase n=1 Tax=Herbiconiux sp. A18JL235 TaxID=3152363 RepID=A0AB39BGX0_9MICO